MKNKFLLIFLIFSIIFLTTCKRKGKVEVNDIYGDAYNCTAPYIVQFDCDVTYQGSKVAYTWDFGDGTISNDKDPEHIYNKKGLYNVKLTIENYQTIHEESIIIDLQKDTLDILSDFDYTATYNYYAPAVIEFTNYSVHATNYFWNFGDNVGSKEFEPMHIFEEAGRYNIQLHAICAGDTTTSSLNIDIASPPRKIFIQEVSVWLPDDYGGYTYALEYQYDIFNETPSGLGVITASSFPLTWIINEKLFFFDGDYDNELLNFDVWDIDNPTSPVYTFYIYMYKIQEDHYPDILTWDDGNGFSAEILIGYE